MEVRAPAPSHTLTDVLVAALSKGFRRVGLLSRRYPLSAAAGGVIFLIVLMAIFAPLISPRDPFKPIWPIARGPSSEHPFGTDFIGRDALSRIIHGARLSLFIGFTSVFLGTTVGAVWGIASGYLGGKFDIISQRLVEVFQSFPSLLLALLLAIALGSGITTVIIAIAVTRVSFGTRIIRAQALGVREASYVDAARAIGATPLRIMARHIAPQCVAPYIVLITVYLGTAIVLEATMGFLGIGVPPPDPTWGNMLGEASAFLTPKWFMVVFPGVAITVTVLGLNLLGDGIRDALDPRLRGATSA